MEKRRVSLKVNGRSFEREVEPRLTLVDLLRHELDLTGTHVGCEHGVCGACTVLIDGRSARSCITFAVQVEGCEITTVESLSAPDGEMNALQHAMREQHGLQCGFCTPGFLMLAVAILERDPDIAESELREALSSNLCRCTGYQNILKSVLAAAAEMRK